MTDLPDRSYIRTSGGKVVHRVGCPALQAARRTWPWHWAEGMTPVQIVAQVPWLKLCKRCMPDA
jgi:hypothetical protein